MVSKLGKTLYFLMLLLIIGVCVVGGYEALAAPGDHIPVTFPDPNLETAIREALNKPEGAIYTSDLESLTELDAYRKGISDLTGLEYCTGLNRLYLADNQISDISPLAGLTSLEVLYLGDNQISDISPLAGLTNLQKLSLYNNQISDISPLAGLTNLQKLYLRDNQISDISPLTGLTKLWDLYLTRNQISDISPLSSLTNLGRLNLKDNQIADISPLVGLTKLETLYLNNNEISDISPLAGLTNLKILFLENNQINDILPLVENSGLSVGNDVVLRNNPLSTDSLNVYIPQLEQRGVKVLWLFIPKPVPPPTPTGEIVNFPDADLETAIRKALNKLEGAIYTSDLESLTKLIADNYGISDLTGLGQCINLQGLELAENQISDISPLANLTNLSWLHLTENQISDISPLANLTNLSWLELAENQISDISPLAGLTNLFSLYLVNNQISDISPLANLANLGWLNLAENQISDISPLAGLTALIRVNLRDNPLISASAIIYMLQLRLKGVTVDSDSILLTILTVIIFCIPLVLVTIYISIAIRRVASWGWARRVLQLSLITIVCGLACYLALTEWLPIAAFPISFLIVSFWTAVTFWSYRSRVSELVALGLIALAPVSFFAVFDLVRHFDKYGDITWRWFLAGSPSAPILAAAGVLFLLRRHHLGIAISVSVLVLLVGWGCIFLVSMR